MIVAPPAQVRVAHAEAMPTRSRSWAGPVVLWSLAGVSLATAGALALVRGEVLAPCTVVDDVAWCPSADARNRAAQAPGLTLGANVLLGVGLAAAAGGAVWWLLGRPSSSPAVQVDHAGVRLGWQGRF